MEEAKGKHRPDGLSTDLPIASIVSQGTYATLNVCVRLLRAMEGVGWCAELEAAATVHHTRWDERYGDDVAAHAAGRGAFAQDRAGEARSRGRHGLRCQAARPAGAAVRLNYDKVLELYELMMVYLSISWVLVGSCR